MKKEEYSKPEFTVYKFDEKDFIRMSVEGETPIIRKIKIKF